MPKKKTAKKATKKVVKKTTKKITKKTPRKTNKKTKQDLAHAPSDQCFWVTDGNVLSNLIELRDALDAMDEKIFAHHVSKEKNDFADWIEHVLGDRELAMKVRKSRKPQTARRVVVSRLRIYNF